MSNERGCIYCRYSDKDRKQGEKIRCKRLSKWVAPRGEACGDYFERYEFPLRVPLSEFLSAEDIIMSAAKVSTKGKLVADPGRRYLGEYVFRDAVPVSIYIDGQKVEAPNAGVKIGRPMFPDTMPDDVAVAVGDYIRKPE